MCLSVQPAAFTGTRTSVHKSRHPHTSRDIHVLGYQNTAKNLNARGPNAMILHLPAAATMDEGNFVDTSAAPRYMRDIAASVLPMPVGSGERGGPLRSFGPVAKALVFDYGTIYTVVLADDASQIAEALTRVPAERRPEISDEIIAFYGESYPGWKLAICCFDNAEAKESEPITIWYEPLFPELLVTPGIDAHSGRAPNLTRNVRVDHEVFFGHEKLERDLTKIRYSSWPEALRPFLPEKAAGQRLSGMMANGDFVLAVGQNDRPSMKKVKRFKPLDYPTLVAA